MLNRSIYDSEFVVVDLETTGISPEKGAKIVEIAAIKVEKGLKLNAKKRFHTLINPGIPIPYSAYRVHKISNEMVKDAPTMEEIFPLFIKFLDTPYIIGQNITFDFSFLSYYFKMYGFNVDPVLIDTISVVKKITPNLKRYNLDSLINYFGIENILNFDHRHRATFDVLATGIVFIKSVEILERYYPDLKIIDLL
jgi:DNA polymerase-3 subunit epsilon